METRATLSYVLKKNKSGFVDAVTLETGTLEEIDEFTRGFSDAEQITTISKYKNKIDEMLTRNVQGNPNDYRGSICVFYIENEKSRRALKPLYSDCPSIHVKATSIEDTMTEVEKTRKLLFNSKNRLFTILFLANDDIAETTSTDIKLSLDESITAMKEGFKPRYEDDNYYLTIKEIMQYSVKVDKLGMMRPLFEDSLEIWKENMDFLNSSKQYYYSRMLYMMMRDYNTRKMANKTVTHLEASSSTFSRLSKDKLIINRNNSTQNKQKVLEVI